MSAGAIGMGAGMAMSGASGMGASAGVGVSSGLSSGSGQGSVGASQSSTSLGTQMPGGVNNQINSLLGNGTNTMKGLMAMLLIAMMSGKDKDKDHKQDMADLLMTALAAQTLQQGGSMFRSSTFQSQSGLSGTSGAASSPMPPVGGAAAAYTGGANAAGAGVGGAVNAVA